MHLSRRRFLASAPLSLALGAAQAKGTGATRTDNGSLLKPRRLRAGDTIGLVSPGGAIFDETDVDRVREALAELDLRALVAPHALRRRGYLAGTDLERAGDLNAMFADRKVDGILALRGGWGCNRILPLLDYPMIRSHPKVLMGFSDVTSLLVALYARCGLVGFHGPVGISTWSEFTVEHFRRVVMLAEASTLRNRRRVGPPRIRQLDSIETITPGRAQGPLVGGNLSVIVSMIGSDYVPAWSGHVLFLEDTREEVYRIDRMLTQLALAGVLDRLAGIVFGQCTRCDPEDEGRSLTLREVFDDHFAPLGIPCWSGAMIGHTNDKWTIPVGVPAEIDARAGTIRLLESAVQ